MASRCLGWGEGPSAHVAGVRARMHRRPRGLLPSPATHPTSPHPAGAWERTVLMGCGCACARWVTCKSVFLIVVGFWSARELCAKNRNVRKMLGLADPLMLSLAAATAAAQAASKQTSFFLVHLLRLLRIGLHQPWCWWGPLEAQSWSLGWWQW